MAEAFIRDNPDLRRFVLSDVQSTGTRIGGGAYGRVDEVAIPVSAAAKTIYAFLQEDGADDGGRIPKAATEFVRECKLMSTLRHPNIVQFLGLCFFPNSRLPALVMERLVTSLHDMLEPETSLPPGKVNPLTFFTVDLKCSVLHDVASGLAFLHEQRPPVVHRDLSARNILLSSDMTAKIADLGVARIVPRMKAAATMTKGPGAIAYMPPEAFAPASSNTDSSKYNASIDVFSFGIVTIFTIGEKFPCDPLEPTYIDEESGLLTARTELERRSGYMEGIYNKLNGFGQGYEGNPLVQLIMQCLHNVSDKRPGIREVLHLLEEGKTGTGDKESEGNKHQLMNTLQIHSMNHNLGHILQDLVTDNLDLQSSVSVKEKELAQFQEQLKIKEQCLVSSENEKQTLREGLVVREADLKRAEEKIVAEQKCKQQEIEKTQAMNKELAKAQQQLREKEDQLRSSEAIVANLQRQLQQAKVYAPYISQVSGPGLTSATVNRPTHICVELSDSSGRPYSLHHNVTASLEHVHEASSTRSTKWPWSKQPHTNRVVVVTTSPFRYEVTYTATKRGKHKLHVQVDNKDIDSSPFDIVVHAPPTQLGQPKKVVTGLSTPYGIAFNSQGEMVVSEMVAHRLSVFDRKGQRIRSFGSRGDSPHQMKYPRGLAMDDGDHIYVTSEHKLQKFDIHGELLKCIGQRGKKEGEFDDPRGVTVHNKNLYICDSDNHRIQVFDMNLDFVRSVGSRGSGAGEFDAPEGVKFDADGNMYVAESGNERVQVLDRNGSYLREFGREGEGKLGTPSGLHIADNYAYVCDHGDDRIVVYETSGRFVTSFGKHGLKEGELFEPRCITSCANGFINVCDFTNNRVQIF